MAAIYKRYQLLIKPEQYEKLASLAARQGRSVAEMTRQAINAGLQTMKTEDEFSRRKQVFSRVKDFRQTLRQQNGNPLELNVEEDIRLNREERDDRLSGRSR